MRPRHQEDIRAGIDQHWMLRGKLACWGASTGAALQLSLTSSGATQARGSGGGQNQHRL